MATLFVHTKGNQWIFSKMLYSKILSFNFVILPMYEGHTVIEVGEEQYDLAPLQSPEIPVEHAEWPRWADRLQLIFVTAANANRKYGDAIQFHAGAIGPHVPGASRGCDDDQYLTGVLSFAACEHPSSPVQSVRKIASARSSKITSLQVRKVNK
jgi:hypothetical protein